MRVVDRYVVTMMLLCASGCSIWTPAASDRAAQFTELEALNWPPRDARRLDELVAGAPRVIWQYSEMNGAADAGSEIRFKTRTPLFKVALMERRGLGVIRELVRVRPRARPDRAAQGDVSAHGSSGGEADDGDDEIERFFEFYSCLPDAEPPVELTGDGRANLFDFIFNSRALVVHAPCAEPCAGMVLYVRPLMSTRYDRSVIDEMRDRGWAVLEMAYVSLIDHYLDADLKRESDIEPTAREIATGLDNLLAERAYAAEAMLDHLAESHPQWKQKPLVAMGFSAGAIGLSTIAARLADRVDALVFVAGGAGSVDISLRSRMSGGGLNVRWQGGALPDDIAARLAALCLERSKLDPFYTARHLAGIPTLVYHGIWDDAVPADTGELLYERLGRPERISYLGGHGLVFWALPGQARVIADWVERQVGAKR